MSGSNICAVSRPRAGDSPEEIRLNRTTSTSRPATGKTICLFSALYAPSMGGVETYTENLARALADLGWRPIVVTMDTHGVGAGGEGEAGMREGSAAGMPKAGAASAMGLEDESGPGDENPARVDDTGVEVVRLPCANALGGRYPLPRRNTACRRAMTWLAAQGPSFVVVNTRFYPLSLAGLAFARRCGIAPVLVEHGSAHLAMGGAAVSKAVEAVEHLMTIRAKRYRPVCYAVSKKASGWLGHFGLQSSGQLPNAIDADAYAGAASERDFRAELGIGKDVLLVASAGRLIPEKGAEELVRAAAMVAGAGAAGAAPDATGSPCCPGAGAAAGATDIHVVMAGAGPLEQHLRETAPANVHLAGRLSRPDLAALLTQADTLCLPSRSEGFATTLLEAAACGLPAIVTDVGGTDELIPDARFGTILADRQPETIAAALTRAAADREKLAAQGRAVAGRVRELCSWQRTAELTITACEQAQR